VLLRDVANDAVTAVLTCYRRNTLRRSRDERDPGATRRKLANECEPEPRCTAGDQHAG
jgi:hypothetical protein